MIVLKGLNVAHIVLTVSVAFVVTALIAPVALVPAAAAAFIPDAVVPILVVVAPACSRLLLRDFND